MNVIKNEFGMRLYVFDGDKLSQLTNKAFGLGNKLAEAIGKSDQHGADAASNEYLELVRETLRTPAAAVDGAAARIAELEAENARLRAATPAGWKLVPVEPTHEMLEEIRLLTDFNNTAMRARYRAMLEAAPAAPAAPVSASPQQAAPAELTDDVREALTVIMDRIEWLEDEGPTGHGWKSDALSSAIATIEAWRDAGCPASHQAAAGAEGAWQPIETAPKERLIHIWIAPVSATGQRWSNGDGEMWAYCYYDRICGEWRTTSPSGHLRCVPERYVTHWMPVNRPAAPSTSQPAREG